MDGRRLLLRLSGAAWLLLAIASIPALAALVDPTDLASTSGTISAVLLALLLVALELCAAILTGVRRLAPAAMVAGPVALVIAAVVYTVSLYECVGGTSLGCGRPVAAAFAITGVFGILAGYWPASLPDRVWVAIGVVTQFYAVAALLLLGSLLVLGVSAGVPEDRSLVDFAGPIPLMIGVAVVAFVAGRHAQASWARFGLLLGWILPTLLTLGVALAPVVAVYILMGDRPIRQPTA